LNKKKCQYEQMDRNVIFGSTVKRFGPFYKWGGVIPKGRENEWNEHLEELKYYMKGRGVDVTKEAIELQIKWAVTTQEDIKGGNVQAYLCNIGIALQVGLVRYSDLPKSIKRIYVDADIDTDAGGANCVAYKFPIYGKKEKLNVICSDGKERSACVYGKPEVIEENGEMLSAYPCYVFIKRKTISGQVMVRRGEIKGETIKGFAVKQKGKNAKWALSHGVV